MAVRAVAVEREVRALRQGLGLTQEELARLLHVSVRTISRWERGQSFPHPLALEKIHRWQRILERARQVLNPQAVPRWFHTPLPALGGRTPFEVAGSPDGEELLLDLLGRLKWGIPD